MVTKGVAQAPFNANYVAMPFFGNFFLHDPSPVIQDGTNYFIYGDGQGISGIKSSDRRNWVGIPPVFAGNPPSWTTNAVPGFTGYFWAPDVVFLNGQYYMYYACSIFGTINSAIGLVTSPSLTSPVWTDQGKVIQSNPDFATNSTTDLTAFNCIDPSILLDTNSTVWMSFGSYSDGVLIMQLDPVTGKRISPTSTIFRVANNGPVFFSNTEEASFLYQQGGYYYLFLNWGGCCDGVDSTYNIRVGRSTNVSGPYFDQNGINLTNGGGMVLLESSARYIGPGQAGIMNDNGTNWFTYHYYDGNNNGAATVAMNQIYWGTNGWPILTNDWSAFYPFQVDAREHRGIYNGSLHGATITNDPALGNVLALNGVSEYTQLANPVANADTFATWVKWNGGVAWQRIFDFGDGTGQYFFLTPSASDGNLRFSITTNGLNAEQRIIAPFPLPSNSWCHVAVTVDGTKGLLYLDGVPVATNLNLTFRPWQTLSASNYIGKSQFSTDPYFSGEVSSFRIFGRALSGSEIANLAYANPSLAHRYSFNTNSPAAAWDSVGMAHGFLMGNATVSNAGLQLPGSSGSYVNLPGGLVSGSSAVTLECWATFGVNGNWARVADFGNISGASGSQYFFYSPHTSLVGQRMELGASTTTTFDISGTLDNQTVHLVCIVDPVNNYAAVYTNAVLEQTMTATWPAFTSVSKNWSFIGRSLFSSDAWLNGTIDELRLYDGRLTTNQITADYLAGPQTLASPVTLSQSTVSSPSALAVSWPSWALGFTLESTTNLTGGLWTPVAATPGLSGNFWSVTIPTTNNLDFYRLQR